MSKRNSKEAKEARRQKYLAKQERFTNPVAKPEQDYIQHYGYIPNEPFFENAAVAWDTSDMKAVFRTKQQLIEYVKDGKVERIWFALVNQFSRLALQNISKLQSQKRFGRHRHYGCKQ